MGTCMVPVTGREREGPQGRKSVKTRGAPPFSASPQARGKRKTEKDKHTKDRSGSMEVS